MKRSLILVLVAGAVHSTGALIAVGAFTGTSSEGFESFPNYLDQPGRRLPDPTSVFGGAAVLHGSGNEVYEPGPAYFGLGGYGSATVHGGIKGLSLNGGQYTRFTFNNLISRFGGYFAHASGASNDIHFKFYDSNLNLIDTEQVMTIGGNILQWRGFSSSIAIKQVDILGFYPAMDDLQVTASTPEPFTMALGLAGAGAFLRRRIKARNA